MKRADWQGKFAAMPPGLTLKEMAQRIGATYRLTATWAQRLGIKGVRNRREAWTLERRKRRWRVPWPQIQWEKLSNAEIARAYNVSREIVRRRRNQYELISAGGPLKGGAFTGRQASRPTSRAGTQPPAANC